jgi:hypothetical protein
LNLTEVLSQKRDRGSPWLLKPDVVLRSELFAECANRRNAHDPIGRMLGHIIYLFAGSNAGGERATAIYSLLGSAKLNGFDPEIYPHHVLERIADHPITQIAELLPWNVTTHSPTNAPQA